MQFRDFSVHKRLLFVNFLMVAVPVCLLLIIGGLLFTGLRLTGNARPGELAMLWPEKGPALSIQYAVSSLRVKAEKKSHPKLHDMQEDCKSLEALGIDTAIEKDGQLLYATPGSDPAELAAITAARCSGQQSMLRWDEDGFAFRYTAQRSGTTILAAGQVPFLTQDNDTAETTRELWETGVFFLLGLAILLILLIGLYLSRMISRQILEPLTALSQAAAAIRGGNLDVPLTVQTQDELGETCRDFDRMRQELRAARLQQQKYDQNRKELIAGISHDLSTPLTTLKGYASGILDGIADTPDKQHHYIERIYQAACSMEKLTESLFLLSKLDLGHVPFTWEIVSLQRYFADFVEENRAALAERGLIVDFQSDAAPAMARIDRRQFQRVVENLLGNSLKYKREEKAAVEIHLAAAPDAPGTLSLRFIDHGIGVDASELPRIFESFYRTDTARTNVARGSGLGLAIVHRIIQEMQGTIRAEGTPGGGLTICITLPSIEGGLAHEKDSDH